MKEKVFNKKTYIILGIILLILIFGFIFRNQIKNGIYNIKTSGISKDIIIKEKTGTNYVLETGYASTTIEYYVDISKQTIYYVEDYNVFKPGEKDYGHHYTLKNSKKLSNEEIEEFKNLVNLEYDYTINSDTPLYYEITYNGQTVETTLYNSTIKNIINNLK